MHTFKKNIRNTITSGRRRWLQFTQNISNTVWRENNITQTTVSGAINNLRQIAIVTCIKATEKKQLKTFAIVIIGSK